MTKQASHHFIETLHNHLSKTLYLLGESSTTNYPLEAIGPRLSSITYNTSAIRQRVVQTPTEEVALSTMQAVLGNQKATWRSQQQQEAMRAVLQRQTDVVSILPTGGGKSMLAIIPSLIEHNMVTIVVLPLNSLIMDYERRLKQTRVPYQVYESSTDLNTSHNLIIVSADKSLTAHWRSALADLGRRKTIARIVIDEAHLPLISKSYRKSLTFIYDIRSEPVPLVLLSATLPPTFTHLLSTTYQLLSSTLTIRQGTNRPELNYILEKVSDETEIPDRAKAVIADHQRTWKPCDRALIFVPSIDMCFMLANNNGWHRYVGDKTAMTEQERQQAYMDWTDGKGSSVMVATSAFSTGNDNLHVRMVMHADKPYNMLEFIQAQGRAGRDGLPAVCYTLVAHRRWKESNQKDPIEKENEQVITDHLFLYGLKRCLRYGMTQYVDGIGISCLEDQANQLCSVCQLDNTHRPQDICIATIPHRGGADPSSNTTNLGNQPTTFMQATSQVKQLKATRELGMLGIEKRLQRALRGMQHACCICLVHNTNNGADKHPPIECFTINIKLGSNWKAYMNWRKLLRYRPHHSSICFICHVPQITDSLHPTFTKTGKGSKGMDCEYVDIIAPTAFAIYHHMVLRQRAESHFETSWGNSLASFADWLMSNPRENSQSNLTDLFLWFYELENM